MSGKGKKLKYKIEKRKKAVAKAKQQIEKAVKPANPTANRTANRTANPIESNRIEPKEREWCEGE